MYNWYWYICLSSGGTVPHDLTVAAAMLYVVVVMRTSIEGQSFDKKVTGITSNWLTEGTCTCTSLLLLLSLPHFLPFPSHPPRLLPGTIPSASCLPCPPCQATTFAVATGYSGAAPLITTLSHCLSSLQQVEKLVHSISISLYNVPHFYCILDLQRPAIATLPLVP